MSRLRLSCYVFIGVLFLMQGRLFAEPKEEIPQCYFPDNWASQLAVANLVNHNYLRKTEKVTQETKLLLSEKIGIAYGKALYRQVQKVVVKVENKKLFELITISEASMEECSMSNPVIILISPETKVLQEGSSWNKK